LILFDLSGSEANPIYQSLAISNGDRQFDFLKSIVVAAVQSQQIFISQSILRALNFHAIACLHPSAGEYRHFPVYLKDADGHVVFTPVDHFRLDALMENFINDLNSSIRHLDPIALAAYVLWKLCHLHPFINGNGRTARAACYFVLCLRFGGLLPGTVFLPSLLKQSDRYESSIRHADATAEAGQLDLVPLQVLISELLAIQIASAEPQPIEPVGPTTT
jgi:Fic family protein